MAQLISDIWLGLRNAGIPEVMLYLPDHSASRCHWDDTTVIGGIRVALLADQERKIVRLLPVDACTGIGVASPKGVDPSGYKATVQNKLNGNPEPPAPAEETSAAPAAVAATPTPAPPPPAEKAPVASAVVEPPARPENPASRWSGIPPRSASPSTRFGATASASVSPLLSAGAGPMGAGAGRS